MDYIQVSYTIQDEAVKEREVSAFRLLDDGYKKILITMDRNPLSNLVIAHQCCYHGRGQGGTVKDFFKKSIHEGHVRVRGSYRCRVEKKE